MALKFNRLLCCYKPLSTTQSIQSLRPILHFGVGKYEGGNIGGTLTRCHPLINYRQSFCPRVLVSSALELIFSRSWSWSCQSRSWSWSWEPRSWSWSCRSKVLVLARSWSKGLGLDETKTKTRSRPLEIISCQDKNCVFQLKYCSRHNV